MCPLGVSWTFCNVSIEPMHFGSFGAGFSDVGWRHGCGGLGPTCSGQPDTYAAMLSTHAVHPIATVVGRQR